MHGNVMFHKTFLSNFYTDLSMIILYIGIFFIREILAKKTVKRRVIFSLSYIFAICLDLNGDFSLRLFSLSVI